MPNQSSKSGTTLLRAFLLCLLGVACIFIVLVSIVWVFSSQMLEREQQMVSDLLPDMDAAYQLTAATAGLQSQGLSLSLSSSTIELTQRREQLNAALLQIERASSAIQLSDAEQRSQLDQEIALINSVVNDIDELKLAELQLQNDIDDEKQALLRTLQELEKTIQASVVSLSDDIMVSSDAMARFNPVLANSPDKLARFAGEVADYDEDNLAVQDYMLLSQDLASLAAIIERVPLLADNNSVRLAEQRRDLLISALVGRSIYIANTESSGTLLGSLRDLRERLRVENSLFNMQSEVLLRNENQFAQNQFMSEHTGRVLEITDALREEAVTDVNFLANLTLDSVRQYRTLLLVVSLFALLALALISYWLLFRKTVQPLLEITQRINDVGSDQFSQQSQPYFLRELTTLSTAVSQLDESTRNQKHQEKRLQLVNQNLRQANKELEQFAHVASHDLQEPLRKLRQFSDILEEDYSSVIDDEGRFFLKTIRSSAMRMSELIKDTLAYSRTGSAKQVYEPVNLNQVIQDVWIELDLAVADAQAQLHLETLPTIRANSVGVTQLFRNLIANGLKYRKPDTPTKISVSVVKVSELEPEFISIRVKDNGIGIAEQYYERIFTPFERLHSGGVAGTGLGLSICKKVCDAHGWSLLVNSKEGKGTAFDVQLPVSSVRSY